MFKKFMTAAAVSAVAIGAGAAAAAPAMAIGNDGGVTTVNGNGSQQIYGNQKTHGDLSPQLGVVQGTLNKPCIGLPVKINAQSLLAAANIGLQDFQIASNPQNQQCTENSTQAKGDETLSHILDNIPILSGNASAGS
ncbi:MULTISPECIES: rodlin [unclassified Streptomyces]|uniref:rodlin n=1 Tax=unclassified Streptomyces TaxID=2593676 RepID=UPI002884FA5C|nr:rodlin [Streptomyces sp. DSM 41633]